MLDVMVDLETVGTRAGCGILSIGAVYFDPFGGGVLGPEFYAIVSLPSCFDVGLFSEPETLEWWSRQPEKAREVLAKARQPRGNTPLRGALGYLNEFLMQGGPDTVRVWGNGAGFDNAILEAAYAACGVEVGWRFWNSRCYRTLKSMVPPGAVGLVREGVHHTALDDARTQAAHAVRLIRHLGLSVV